MRAERASSKRTHCSPELLATFLGTPLPHSPRTTCPPQTISFLTNKIYFVWGAANYPYSWDASWGSPSYPLKPLPQPLEKNISFSSLNWTFPSRFLLFWGQLGMGAWWQRHHLWSSIWEAQGHIKEPQHYPAPSGLAPAKKGERLPLAMQGKCHVPGM